MTILFVHCGPDWMVGGIDESARKFPIIYFGMSLDNHNKRKTLYIKFIVGLMTLSTWQKPFRWLFVYEIAHWFYQKTYFILSWLNPRNNKYVFRIFLCFVLYNIYFRCFILFTQYQSVLFTVIIYYIFVCTRRKNMAKNILRKKRITFPSAKKQNKSPQNHFMGLRQMLSDCFRGGGKLVPFESGCSIWAERVWLRPKPNQKLSQCHRNCP